MKKNNLILLLMASTLLASCGKQNSSSPSDEPNSSEVGPSTSDTSSSGGATEVTNANGTFTYVAASYEERTKILGKLEKYAVDNYLTGITLYEDGGYVMYDNSIKKGTNTYILGYGFGIITEGEITADLEKETNANWKRYYHTFETSDPKTINYMNDDGSVVGDYIGYISASYFDTQMNETKDGYEWVPVLAKDERPVALNADSDGLATKYRFEVKVGQDAKYGTASSKFSQFNGRAIALEDYLTPYKMMYTQAYGMKRGADQLSGSGSIKGMQAYYNASKGGFDEKAWANVGIKAYVEGGKSYLEFEFNQKTNQFYAMYYLSSALYAPLPEEFIKAIGNDSFENGVKNYGNFTSDLSMSPVDTTLSCGPYVLETWNQGQEFVFKKNTNFNSGNRYKVGGIHVKILTTAKDDPEAGFNQFLGGYIHATSIPTTKLAEYKSDPRTTTTVGSTTTKLNINTCTQEEWAKLFGENGSVLQTSKENTWTCEPAMSNEDFIRGLSYAINRAEICEKIGRTPTINYFGSAYLSDPENGVAYNSTQEHADAVKDLLNGTDPYGYSLEKAKAAFKSASEALIKAGKYKEGDTIKIEVTYQGQANITNYGNAVKQYWENAFNSCGGGLKLSVEHYVPSDWQEAYTKKMKVGQFDIGLGGINGNPLNPLNFIEVLKSDNSSRFTLNWGVDTNECTKAIEYDGKYWSFDALWSAADRGAYVVEGRNVKTYGVDKSAVTMNADGTATVTADITTVNIEGKVSTKLTTFAIFSYDAKDNYVEDEITIDNAKFSEDGKTVTITISKELVAKYKALSKDDLGLDFYFDTNVLGTETKDQIVSIALSLE